jgi:ribonuclease P protein component
MDRRLGRANRIRKKKSFDSVFKHGTLFRGVYLQLWRYQEGLLAEGPQVGIVVSRKVASLATDRNRYRRQIREIFRRFKTRIAAENRIVIRLRARPKTAPFRALETELESLFTKAGFLK